MYRYLINCIISLVVLVFSIIRLDEGGSLFYITLGLSIVSLALNLVLIIRKSRQ
jgi:hypothetical protein